MKPREFVWIASARRFFVFFLAAASSVPLFAAGLKEVQPIVPLEVIISGLSPAQTGLGEELEPGPASAISSVPQPMAERIGAFIGRAKEVHALEGAPRAVAANAPDRLRLELSLGESLSGLSVEDIGHLSAGQLHEFSMSAWDNAPRASFSNSEGSGQSASRRSRSGEKAPRAAAKTLASAEPAEQPEGPARGAYRRRGIAAARFGDKPKQELIARAYQLADKINGTVFGQEAAAAVVQERLVQYLENVGKRTKDPVALHMIGLPGIGKSMILDQIEAVGIPTLRLDAQNYVKDSMLSRDLVSGLKDYLTRNPGKPVCLFLEELDKLPEHTGSKQGGESEESNSFIGTLNRVLNDGKLPGTRPGTVGLDLSNVFVVTTMNLAPGELQHFSATALGKEKDFFDFEIPDFAAFHTWISTRRSAKYQVLAKLFRTNTIGRIAPNTIILKPLNEADYKKVTRQTIAVAIERNTQGPNASRRLTVNYTDALLDFLARTTSFGPSGARETIAAADMLMEQLIEDGARASAVGDRSLDQPRRIDIDFDEDSQSALITVTPELKRGGAWADGRSFAFSVPFDPALTLFKTPDNVAIVPPAQSQGQAAPPRPYRVKDIIKARFPENASLAHGLAAELDKELIGQGEFTALAEREMNAYLGRRGPARKEPSSLVFAGFPGIGKSALFELMAKVLDIPLIKINLQAYASDDKKSVDGFFDMMEDKIEKAKAEKNWRGKYIVLFEEMDKAFELDRDGNQKDRPIMAVVKDLLNNGLASTMSSGGFSLHSRNLDLRRAFIGVTMNFAVDRFGFVADPRFTSAEDVRKVWEDNKKRLWSVKWLMGTMFLPDTVNRLMPKLHIMAPLTEEDYAKVVGLQVDAVANERLGDQEGGNPEHVRLVVTPAYRKYLLQETMVPSEGARYTSVLSRIKIAADLEAALRSMDRRAPYAGKPATITLDYKPRTTTVIGMVVRSDTADKPSQIYKKKVALYFPPMRVSGKISENRLHVSVHEFGHAYTRVRLGQRFESMQVYEPKPGIGGYVKFSGHPRSAGAVLASIYTSLASRALERIFLSPDPLNDRSVLDISPGASSDIQSATRLLYKMLFELGFAPQGGTLARLPFQQGYRYAEFEQLPAEVVEKLGLVLRDMEDHIVRDIIEANPMAWYVEKITAVARAGNLTEREFYRLLEYPYPGETKRPDSEKRLSFGETSSLREHFKGVIRPEPKRIGVARQFAQGPAQATALDNMRAYVRKFVDILDRHLGLGGAELTELAP